MGKRRKVANYGLRNYESETKNNKRDFRKFMRNQDVLELSRKGTKQLSS